MAVVDPPRAGVLGAAVLLLMSPNDVTRVVAAEAAGQLDQFPGWQTTQLPDFEVALTAWWRRAWTAKQSN
jgi:hypothetical protein